MCFFKLIFEYFIKNKLLNSIKSISPESKEGGGVGDGNHTFIVKSV